MFNIVFIQIFLNYYCLLHVQYCLHANIFSTSIELDSWFNCLNKKTSSSENCCLETMSLKLLQGISLRNKYSCYGWIRMQENILKLSQIVPSVVKVICILYFRDNEIFNNVSDRAAIQLSSNKKIISRPNVDEEEKHVANPYNTLMMMAYQEFFPNNCDDASSKDYPIHNNLGITEINSDQEIRVQWDLLAKFKKIYNRSPIKDEDIGCILIGIADKDDHVNKHIHGDGDTNYYLFNWRIGQTKMKQDDDDTDASRFFYHWTDDSHVQDVEWAIHETYGSDEYRSNGDYKEEISFHLDLRGGGRMKLVVNGFDLGWKEPPIKYGANIKYKLCVILDDVGESVEILDFKIY